MAAFSCFQDATCSELRQGIENEIIACIRSFKLNFAILFMQLRGLITASVMLVGKTGFSAEVED
jgi:glyoxylase-like metal-dependent hydrolase (beta-lactamase superfamily II)